MNQITKKIYNLLKDNNIPDSDMEYKLQYTIKELNNFLWYNIIINPILFYRVKDIVWYNQEHLINNGQKKGITDLRYLGSKYPNFIMCGNDSNIIETDKIPNLLIEIEDIIKCWDKNWKYVELYTKSPEGWQGGIDNPSKVIIYHSETETPMKYGYNKTYGSIINEHGNKIKKIDDNIVLCSLGESIGEYSHGTMLFQLLIQLKQSCIKAINLKQNIKLNFKQ
ncbi:MAG: hypothetical protein ACOCP8_04870 [archaeon]